MSLNKNSAQLKAAAREAGWRQDQWGQWVKYKDSARGGFGLQMPTIRANAYEACYEDRLWVPGLGRLPSPFLQD